MKNCCNVRGEVTSRNEEESATKKGEIWVKVAVSMEMAARSKLA